MTVHSGTCQLDSMAHLNVCLADLGSQPTNLNRRSLHSLTCVTTGTHHALTSSKGAHDLLPSPTITLPTPATCHIVVWYSPEVELITMRNAGACCCSARKGAALVGAQLMLHSQSFPSCSSTPSRLQILQPVGGQGEAPCKRAGYSQEDAKDNSRCCHGEPAASGRARVILVRLGGSGYTRHLRLIWLCPPCEPPCEEAHPAEAGR